MSRPGSFRDLDAVLRDDLALDDIAYGHRPHGPDPALGLLYAMVDDTGVRVPRRRAARGRRFTRGLIVTTAAATMLGATGVAAAQPGGSDRFPFAIFSRGPEHARAADKSLTDAQRSLREGDPIEATRQLNQAKAELAKARGADRARLRKRATTLRERVATLQAVQPAEPQGSHGKGGQAQQNQPSWPWSWGIPGGGPGWQPHQAAKTPYCLLIVCADAPATDTPPPTDEPALVEAGPVKVDTPLFKKLPPKNETQGPLVRVTVPVQPLLHPLLAPLAGESTDPAPPQPSGSVSPAGSSSAKPSKSSSDSPSSSKSSSESESPSGTPSSSRSSGSSSPSSSSSSPSSSSPSQSSGDSGSPTPNSSDTSSGSPSDTP